MTEHRLPQEAVEQDHALEGSAEKASESLAAHRWHWTLNEGNPERVSIREYARSVGRAKSTVAAQVNGYASYLLGGVGGPARPLSEEVERARVGAEKESVIEAIADARGLAFKTVRESAPNDVRRVREIARERAEAKGTSVGDEARDFARFMVKAEKAEKAIAEERVSTYPTGFLEIEGHTLAALRSLRRAVIAANKYHYADEYQEMLKATVNDVREVLQLLDARITGITPIDWDAQLASIMAGVAE
jgi:hypothetical protein